MYSIWFVCLQMFIRESTARLLEQMAFRKISVHLIVKMNSLPKKLLINIIMSKCVSFSELFSNITLQEHSNEIP